MCLMLFIFSSKYFLLFQFILSSCVVTLLVTECVLSSPHHSNSWSGNQVTQVDIDNNNVWGAMMSHLNYKLSLKNKVASSFQSIKRLLKMSKPMKPWSHKPMKPWPQKPMKPWPQKPMKPWPEMTPSPWVPVTEAPTQPPPPPTTTPPPPPPTTTAPPTTPAPIDIDIPITEDYFPFPVPNPIEDVDIGVGPAAIFRPDTRIVTHQQQQSQFVPQATSSYQVLPFYQYFNFVPRVIQNFLP